MAVRPRLGEFSGRWLVNILERGGGYLSQFETLGCLSSGTVQECVWMSRRRNRRLFPSPDTEDGALRRVTVEKFRENPVTRG
ncbi:hypothetical protein CTA1_2370 [Colletotrichum tanaceti]|uniref:Uncharacterized protein n=1 Tax=Colletotrichum tanaceti TaxID=1306861 RepID=A0A4V6DGL5_9PEZI|nr:hypothetical protein CTA1_2370 [Colletotrichum tanaceti]